MKYRVMMTGTVDSTVDVETDETNPEKIFELALENTPSLCAQCSGYGQNSSLELGDEWEPVPVSKNDPTPIIFELEC